MRSVAPPVIDTSLHQAVAASVRGWLVSLLAWFCDVFDMLPPAVLRCPALRVAVTWAKAQVAGDLRSTARLLRALLVGWAFARMSLAARRRRVVRRPGAARLRRTRRSLRRRLTGGVLSGLHTGSLRQRTERLRALFEEIETLLTRILARMHAMWRRTVESSDALVADNAVRLSAAHFTPLRLDSS